MTEGGGSKERKSTKEEGERRKRDEWREGKRGNGNIGDKRFLLYILWGVCLRGAAREMFACLFGREEEVEGTCLFPLVF